MPYLKHCGGAVYWLAVHFFSFYKAITWNNWNENVAKNHLKLFTS